ncbi:hypothetical protein HY78_07810 [Rhizorhabdus wittichii DC-6]|nr:hypothetical protein HY78_07810 [Rhizorhabdus wittichii DC-6]
MPPDIPAKGLTSEEAARRLGQDGPNGLPVANRRGIGIILVETMREPMLSLLLMGGVAYYLLGDRLEATVLLAFATFSVAITVWQNYRTERILSALRDLAAPRAMVLRDGKPCRIAGHEVVRGDVLLVETGDRIAADAEILVADRCETDESLLSGESLAISKHGPMPSTACDDSQRLFGGTLVTQGTATALVIATGVESAIGRIGATVAGIDATPPRLTLETRRIVRFCGLGAAMVAVAVILLFGFLRGSWLEALLAGIAIGMAMIPEEFPVVLTIFLAVGAWRIAKVGVLARRAAAIETLGAATVLCVDKTGTLTENRMAVAGYWRPGGPIVATCDPALLRAAVGASAVLATDAMEIAFHEAARGQDGLTDGLDGARLERSFPLSEACLAMANLWQETAGGYCVYAKGAPETVMTLCGVAGDEREAWRHAIEAMAERGMRILGLAVAHPRAVEAESGLQQIPLVALGLIGLSDPLRETVPAAIASCRRAAIKVMMITGDHVATARSIARTAGLADSLLLTGADIDSLGDDLLSERLMAVDVVARARPEQKLRIVEALKRHGEVVAMTGDGVNDAPALKAADIGVAMGKRGTDVAREAAALVLLEDDFGAIVAAIALGRRIYDNIRKAIGFIFAVHVPIATLALLPLLTGLPILLAPIHIALLEMIIDPACALVFEVEAAEPDLMRRPPRDPGARLFSWRRIRMSVEQGGLAAALLAALCLALDIAGIEESRLRGIMFFSLVSVVLALILNNRRLTAGDGLRLGNRPLAILLGGVGLFAAACLVVMPLRQLLQIHGLAAVDLMTAAAVGGAMIAAARILGLGAGLSRPLTAPRDALCDRQG